MNCSEYSALLAAPLFYLAAMGHGDDNPTGVLLAVVGQVGYFWTRVLVGYPTVPVATMATIRYVGFLFICKQLFTLSSGAGRKK